MPKDPWGIASVDDEDDPWGIASIDDEGPDIKMNPVRGRLLAERDKAGGRLGDLGADRIGEIGAEATGALSGPERALSAATDLAASLNPVPGALNIIKPGLGDSLVGSTAKALGTGAAAGLAGIADLGRGLGDVGAFMLNPKEYARSYGTEIPRSAFPDRVDGDERGAAVTRGGAGGWLDDAAGGIERTAERGTFSAGRARGEKGLAGIGRGKWYDVPGELLGDPEAAAALAGSAAGSLGSTMALGTVGRAAPLVGIGLQELHGIEEAQRAEEEKLGRNINPLERAARQVGTAGAIAGLERVVPDELMRASRGARRGVAGALLTPIKEGGTEAAQRVLADVGGTPEGAFDPTGTLIEGIGGVMGGAALGPLHLGKGGADLPEAPQRDIGREVVDHVANLSEYRKAAAKKAAIDEFSSTRGALEKAQATLREAVNVAAETNDPKDQAAAADAKAQADVLEERLAGMEDPGLLDDKELGWVRRGKPKLGQARGGGNRVGRRIDDVDEDGNPIRLAAPAEDVEAEVLRLQQVDPALANVEVVVHEEADESFPMPDEERARYNEAIAAGASPQAASSLVAAPGSYDIPTGRIHVLAPALISWDHLRELVSGHELTHGAVSEAISKLNDPKATSIPLFGDAAGKERTFKALGKRAGDKTILGKTVARDYPGASPEVLAEEVLAVANEFAGTGKKASTSDRIVRRFRDSLRRVLPGPLQGFVAEASDAEIRVLLTEGRKLLASRGKPGGVSRAQRPAPPAAAPVEATAPQQEPSPYDRLNFDLTPGAGPTIDEIALFIERITAEAEEASRKEAAAAPPAPVRGPATAGGRDVGVEQERAAARQQAQEAATRGRAVDDRRGDEARQAELDARAKLAREREAAQQAEVVGAIPMPGPAVLSNILERGAVSERPQPREPLPEQPIPVDQLIARTEEKAQKKATGKAPAATAPQGVPPVAGTPPPTAPAGPATKKTRKVRHSVRTRLGDETRERGYEEYSLANEQERARVNPKHWVRYAVPDTPTFSSDAATVAAKATLRQLGIDADNPAPINGLGPNGVWSKQARWGEVIVTTWPDGRPAYAYSVGPTNGVSWALRFPGGGAPATTPGETTKAERTARLLEQTDPEHPFRVAQGELASRNVVRDPTTDPLSPGGLATAELLAPADSFVKKFRRWSVDPTPIRGRVRYEHGNHDVLSDEQIQKGLEDLRTGRFGTAEAHAINMRALDEERAELAAGYNKGGKIRTAEEVFGRDDRRVVGAPGAAEQTPEGLGRGGVSRADEGLGAGTPQRGEAGRARGGELQAARGDARVEEEPFPEASEPLPPFKARYSMAGASARTADRDALKRAQKMVRAGASDDESWRETGWRRFPDGRWRFEISDHDAKLNDDVYARIPFDFKIGVPQVTLGELLDHPDLFAAYPRLRDMRVVRASQDDGGTVAALDKKAGKVLLYSRIDREPEGPMSYLLHEIQHAIQDTEGFAKGGSPETVARSVPESEARQYAEREAEALERSAEELDADAASLEERAALYAPISAEMKEIRDTMFSEFSRREERVERALEKARAIMGDELSLGQLERLESDVRNGRHPGVLLDRANEIRRRAVAMREDAEKARGATGPALQRYVDRHADTFEFYKRLAGEAEARQTQARQRLTPEERRARDPYLDFDVPPEKQLIDRRRYSVRGEPTVGPDGVRRLTIFHMSNRDGLEEIDPKFQGTGQAGAEMKRRYDDGFEPFSNWYTGEPSTLVEAHRFGGKPMYEFEVALTNEPGGVIELGKVGDRTPAQLKDAGFLGVYYPDYGQVRMLQPVEPQEVGKAPLPGRPVAKGNEFYREATGREARFSRRQEETPEFRAWFGDWKKDPKNASKVVDKEGRPKVVYHGTTSTPNDFSEFAEGYDLGVHFGGARTASVFARGLGGRVYPVYLNIRNPLELPDVFDSTPTAVQDAAYVLSVRGLMTETEHRRVRDAMAAAAERRGDDFVAYEEGVADGWAAVRRAIEAAGHDGVVYQNTGKGERGGLSYIAFRPEQIKSATGNSGAFDPGNPDIRFSRRDPAEAQVSWEALPGKSTGWLRGIHAAPYEIRAAFTADVDTKVLRDSMGRDRIARLFGVDETDSVVAPGYWKGERNPSRQLFVRVPDGPDGLEKVKAYAAARGYVLRQEAVGVHLARNPQPGERINGYHADIGRVPTTAEYADFVNGVNKAATNAEVASGAFVPVPTHAGINMWTWDDSISPERVREVYEAALANIRSDVSGTAHPLVVDSELVENNWQEAPNGEVYVQRFTPSAGSPGVQSSLDQLREAADKVGRQWASRHGWGTKLGAAEPAVPRDLESLVGRDVNPGLKGARRAKLFKDIARMIDGRALADMKFAAEAGRAMKGWYRDSWQAIEKLFGEDAERFTGLLAALSPQQGVKENLRMAVDAWQTWVEAGRPADRASVEALFPVVGRKWSSVQKRWINQYATVEMEARFNNAITALTDPGAELSGNKVESFRRNLRGDFDAVTNDIWMAYFSEWQQKVFDTETGYLAGSYLVRRAAKKLGWTPAEAQETVWTFFRELANRTGVDGVKATDVMAKMTMGDVISGSDSFAHLVRDPDVQKRLSALGIDVRSLPDLPRLSDEEAAAPAVRPEDRATGVSRRVAGRAQRQADSSWARSEIAAAGVEGLNDSDHAALKKLAAALGVPTEGRTRNQTIAALRAYADPTRYSRRTATPFDFTRSRGPADIPLETPQVDSVVDRLVESEGFAIEHGASYTPKPLDSDKPRRHEVVEHEAKVADFQITDEQLQRKVASGKPLTDKEVMLANIRMETRREEMNDATTRRLEAEAMSAAERASKDIDLGRLRIEEIDATLAHINMVLVRKNAGTALARGLAAMARKMEPGTKLTPDILTMKLMGIPGIHPKSIADLYRKYQDGDIEGFRDGVRKAIEPTWQHKWAEYYRGSLLTGIPTHMANFTGNIAEPALRAAETVAAAGVDKIVSTFRGTPRERFLGEARHELRGQMKAIAPAFRKLTADLYQQVLLQKEPTLDLGRKFDHQVGAIGGRTGTLVRTPFRALGVADDFFKSLGFAAEVEKRAYREARKEGLEGRDAERRAQEIIREAAVDPVGRWRGLMDAAHRGTLERVFQEDPAKIVRLAMQIANDHPLAAAIVVPFLKTPGNITRTGWRRSPMGLALPGDFQTKAKTFRAQQAELRAGRTPEGEIVSRGDVEDALARGAVGTALATTFGLLAAAGMMTGSGPTDDKEKNAKRATGWQPYSFVIPGAGGDGKPLYVPFSRFEPTASLLGNIADAFELGDERSVLDKVTTSISTNWTNKTYFKGLNDAAAAITTPNRAAKRLAGSIVAAHVPNIVAKAADAADPVLRETRSESGLAGLGETVKRGVARRIPGVSRAAEPMYTATGEEAAKPGTGLTRFLSPTQATSLRSGTELEAYMAKIHEVPGDVPDAVAIPKELLPSNADVDWTGTRIFLTNEERAFLAKARREAASRLRAELPLVQQLPVDDQRSYVRKAFTQAQTAATKELWLTFPALRERARKKLER